MSANFELVPVKVEGDPGSGPEQDTYKEFRLYRVYAYPISNHPGSDRLRFPDVGHLRIGAKRC